MTSFAGTMPTYDAVLYDLDGTLIDSIRLILDSYHHTLSHHRLPPRPDAYWLNGIGTPLRAQFAEWAHDEATMEALIATYREYNLTHHDTSIAAYPGVPEAVRSIRARGIVSALVTSKNRYGAQRGLRVVGLHDCFDSLVCADDVERPKPDPEPVARALEALGVTAERAVFVGDSLHDMHAGRAAGVATAAVLWGPFAREHLAPAEPDHWLETPAALTHLVLSEGVRSSEAPDRS